MQALGKFSPFVSTHSQSPTIGNKSLLEMKTFSTLDKDKPDTENIRGLNLAAVMCKTVQVNRLSF
jgi:hypothetical protein